MSTFDDRLLSYLVREHGDLLQAEHRSAAKAPRISRRRRRRLFATAGGLGLAGTVIALALTVVAFSGKAAYAVTQNTDGTVTITLREIFGVGGVNQQLADLGVRAKAFRMDPNCPTTIKEVDWTQLYPRIVPDHGPTPMGEAPRITIAPDAIPADKTLVLAAREGPPAGGGDASIAVRLMLIQGQPPACVGQVLRDPTPPPAGVGQRIDVPSLTNGGRG